ncbi:MAG: periplasmic heavy metal sensor [Spirochaetes bacterium]|nr:periplasmic heavy metal sensor [Spirochaetota bacterium]
MKKLFLPLILLGFIVFIIADVSAQMNSEPNDMPPRSRGKEKGMRNEMYFHGYMFFGDPDAMKEKLGFTDEQMEKIGQINDEYRKKLLKIREDMDQKMNKLHSLLSDENINLINVRSLFEEISVYEVDIRMLKINHILDIEKVLTPVQRKQLRKSMRRMMGYLNRQQLIYSYNSGCVYIN